MRLTWCTDIHLDHLDVRGRAQFASKVAQSASDAVLITGDISEGGRLRQHLEAFAEVVQRPVYFVLGNHDFYSSAITTIRHRMEALTESSPWLRWLPANGPVALDEGTWLVGCDGVGDGRLGDMQGTAIMLNDHLLIDELTGLSRETLAARLAALGDAEARTISRQLLKTIGAKRVLIATHVPPFREAAWHEGKPSDDAWLPFFACKAVGDVLQAHADAHPSTHFVVVTGHTHSAGTAQIRPNLVVHTGASEYGAPRVSGLIDTTFDALVETQEGPDSNE